MNVAGVPSKPNALGIFPQQDLSGRYTKRCIAFADDNGWPRKDVCQFWSQIAMAVELVGKRDRITAEDAAWHHVQAALHALRMEPTN